MGGIPVNTDGRVRSSATGFVEGFFAAGECSCVSVHGANRLGSNSLLECVVYGRRVGRSIAAYIKNRQQPQFDEKLYLQTATGRIKSLLNRSGDIRIASLRQEFQDCMTEHCGVFRDQETMETGLVKIRELKQKYDRIYLDDKGNCWNTELIEALELKNIIIVGELILASALNRKESRGSHAREDYSDRNDHNFLQHTLASITDDRVEINYMPVVVNMFEPQERKY
jgi:succinate dehydrogenase / fumarate reductase flavoprotein subunit